MTTFAEIDDFPASLLVGDFMICRRCGVVDQEHSRIRVNSICPSCKEPAGVARLYYHVGIRALIDLIQEAYNSTRSISNDHGLESENVAVVIFFCTLREALLDHFLNYLFLARKIPDQVSKKLLKDNRLVRQKLEGLLPALIGKSWEEAVREASNEAETDFTFASDFMKQVAILRNQFIHQGNGWNITREVATKCVNNLFDMLRLFVSLHNLYIKPSLQVDHF